MIVKTYYDIAFIVKLLVPTKAFTKILGRGLGDNSKYTNGDLFKNETIMLGRGFFCKIIFGKHNVIELKVRN